MGYHHARPFHGRSFASCDFSSFSFVCALVTAFVIGEAFASVESCSSDVVMLTLAVVYWCMTGLQGQTVVAGTHQCMKWSNMVRSSAVKPCHRSSRGTLHEVQERLGRRTCLAFVLLFSVCCAVSLELGV